MSESATPFMISKLIVAFVLLSMYSGSVTALNVTPPLWQNDAKVLLAQALSGIGDVGSARASMKVSEQITDLGTNSGAHVLTNVYDSGTSNSSNVTLQWSNGVYKVEIQYQSIFCVCVDEECTVQVAADLNGAYQVDGLGYSPLLFLDENGNKLPCLSGVIQKDLTDLDFRGCDLAPNALSVEIVNALDSRGCYVYKDFRNYLNVSNCTENSLTRFEVLEQKSQIPIARPYSHAELHPGDIIKKFNASQTLGDAFGPNASVLDLIGKVLLQCKFRDVFNASKATFEDTFSIALDYSLRRLQRLASSFGEYAKFTISGDAIYLNLLANQPDLVKRSDILSGITVLAMVAAGFGYAVAGLPKAYETCKASGFSLRNSPMIVLEFSPFLGALVVFGTEMASYCYRVTESKSLDNWQENMLLVEAHVSSRTYMPLTTSLDGGGLIVTIASVHLENDSKTHTGLQWFGLVFAFLSLVVGILVGLKPAASNDVIKPAK